MSGGVFRHRPNCLSTEKDIKAFPHAREFHTIFDPTIMSPITNARHVFKEIPQALPVPGKHTAHDTSKTIDLENVALRGGFLVKTIVLSIDPYMRLKLRDPSIKSYSVAYTLGEPLDGHGIAKVLRSENAAYKEGDYIYGIMPHEQYWVGTDPSQFSVVKNDLNLPWSVYVGVMGMPGQTAYVGWREFSHAKKGETVFITTAAGAVGSFVVQLAKVQGLKVIASSGSDDKVAYTRELGADVAFNYKNESTREVLEREGPIDIYWDNVGGEVLDLALEFANVHARFIECGMASSYNEAGETYRLKNLFHFISKQISLNGFIVYDLFGKHSDAFYDEVPRLIKERKLKYQECVTRGLESAPQGLRDVSDGSNTGKVIIAVADE
ncbi:alcohol dehydrogenase [Artomyces pyxidatus]|uniref:Alcohol dehydrogenase n=1 Tax=Artomyces pyxidatus TaxID=48021 RepID=A0ACB8SHI4_9AGAM|nr:alcohol dehydrogenase [Artomyces pyxidatus]